MQPSYDYGDEVRVIRNIHNDGTYPGIAKGALLARRGSVGFVRNVGTFLQDQIIYSVDFLTSGRLVGCREQELIAVNIPWIESRFESREKVCATLALAMEGRVVVPAGEVGEVLEVLRNTKGGVHYYVHFKGRTLQVPETALTPVVSEDRVMQQGV